MWTAFPSSDYYGSSAPHRRHRLATRFPYRRMTVRDRRQSSHVHLGNACQAWCPAMPQRLRHGYAAGLHHGLVNRRHTSEDEFSPAYRDTHRNPAHIYQVRAGGCLLRGFMARVPLVHRPVSLAEPAPSGSAGTTPRCQGCLPLLLPYRRSSCPQLLSACCDRPTAVLFHHCTFPKRLVAHDIPAPKPVRRRSLVSGWWALTLRGLLSAPVMLLIIFMKDSVHRRLRGQVAALVRLIGHDEGRRAAPILWGVAQRHDRLSLFGRQLVGRLRAVGVGAAIRRHPALSDPAIVGPHIDAHHLTGLGQPSTVTLGVLHQGHDTLAIREAGQSSSSLVVPQIASAFFDRASSAAVSARALSLRCSSRSSLRSRFCSALRA